MERLNATRKRHGGLIKRLALPMVVLAVLCLALSLRTNGWWQGVLIELAMTFLGVLITVFYVESVLRTHEAERWAGADAIVTTRIKVAVTRAIEGVSSCDPDFYRGERFMIPWVHMRVKPTTFWEYLYDNQDWIAYVKDVVIPNTGEFVEHMKPEDIEAILSRLASSSRDLAEVMLLFREVLHPSEIENIAKIQLAIRQAQSNAESIKRHGNLEAKFQLPNNLAEIMQYGVAMIEMRDQR